MPINDSDLMISPGPSGNPFKLNFGGLGGGNSLEMQRLQLMREEFENTKKQQLRQEELRKLEESGRMQRERMQGERDAAAAQAAKAAELQKQKLTALTEFTKLNGGGDIEGARAMVPLMSSLGMVVDLEGEDGGLPRYRIHMSQEEADRAQNQGSIGYPEDDSREMLPPAGVGSTEDAFNQALGASQTFEQTGQPARAPDESDFTGGVPRNVIDTGAIAAQTGARLNPALSGLVAAYPQPYRESAQSTALAVSGMGLPLKESLKQFDTMRSSPDSLIRADIAAEAQAGEQRARMAQTGGQQAQSRYDSGSTLVKSLADDFKLNELLERRTAVSNAAGVLLNGDDADDHLAGSAVSRLMGERGATTEGDIKRALGTSAMSFLDQIKAGAYQKAIGGLDPTQKDALLGVLRRAADADAAKVNDFLGNIDEVLASPDTDPDVARGIRGYRTAVVPKAYRDAYESRKPKRPFNMEEDSAKRGAYDPAMSGTTIPESSRIAFEHNNPGNLKFVGQDGATKGEAASDGGNWAKFESVDAGLEALRQQILRDAEAGLSVQDYITKYAPPGSNDTKTYIEQAARELKAKPTDALAETDPYDVLRFIARKESGTELPDQYSESPAADPAARARELLKKGGY